MYNRKRLGILGQAAPATVQPHTVPASTGGINSLQSLQGMNPEDCIFTHNLMPSEYGLRLRKGYREWSTGTPSDVRSLIPYDNQQGLGINDRLFAACAEGIYDVSLFGTTVPEQEVPFTSNGVNAGHGVFTNFTTDADQHLVFYADGENGLHQYDGDSELWSVPAITGVDATNIAFITNHKQRLWIIEEDSADAWYLPIDAIAGEATKFTFGSKFKHGGRLVGLWGWTIDGGDGVDDFLVAVSRAGDVLVYYGADPSLPDWALRGAYYIGELPQGRKLATDYGGDLWLLSTYGVISVRDLLMGVDFSDVKVGPAAKVARILRGEILAGKNSNAWQLNVHPGDGFLQVVTPTKGGAKPRQYNMNLLTSAWGWWRDVPMLTGENWKGEYMLGGPDGIVYIYDDALDNTKLDATLGLPIEFEILTSFQPYGEHAQNILPGIIRAIGITQGGVSINVQAVFDYQLDAFLVLPASVPTSGASLWGPDGNAALWGVGTWDFATTGNSVPIGVLGVGRTLAIAMRGTSSTRITLIAWDVLMKSGGLL